MFTDVMAIGLSPFAITMSARSHSRAIMFGYHRAEVMVALANGVALAAISLWVSYEAFLCVMSPRIIDALLLLISGIGLAGDLVLIFLLTRRAGKSITFRAHSSMLSTTQYHLQQLSLLALLLLIRASPSWIRL